MLAHMPRKTRTTVPSGQLGSGLRGEYHDCPCLRSAQLDPALFHVWSPRLNCLSTPLPRRLPQPRAHAGKAPSPDPGLLAKVSLNLIGYMPISEPIIMAREICCADCLGPRLHTPTLSQKGSINCTRKAHRMSMRSWVVSQSKIMVFAKEGNILLGSKNIDIHSSPFLKSSVSLGKS